MVLQASDYTNGAFTYITKAKTLYDSYGRTTASTDANGNTTTLSYTTTNGLTTSTTTKNPLQQSTTATVDPTRGLTTKTVDANGLETDLRYDALGRLTGVWLPGNNDTSKAPNQKYNYLISQTQPSAVTSASLNENGSYTTSVIFFDALDRQRQTQSDTPRGGRLVTDTFYDSRGWAYKLNNAYWDNTSTPSTTLLDMRGHDEDIPNEDLITFDGLGRPVLDASLSMGVEQWHTQTVYGGDRTTVIPPDGGTPITTITDALNRTTEQDNYNTPPTVTGNRVTGGTLVKTTYGYDHRGNQNTLTDNDGHNWVSTIDLLGHTVTQTDPDSGTSHRSYDNNGNVLTSTDARNNTISYSYDPLNRKTAEYDGPTSTAPKLAEWNYDSTTITNGIGQLSSETSYTGTTAYTTTISGYSNRYLPLATTITIPTDGALAGSYTFTNKYTPTTGEPWTTDYPATSGALPRETVTYGYNTQGQLVSVGGNGPYIEATTFTPYGQPERVQLGILTNQISYVSNTYDPHTLRLKDTAVDRSVAPVRLDDVSYTYDHAGLITHTTDTRNNTTSETQCFDYNLLDQLTTAWTATDGCTNDVAKTTDNTTVGGINPYWTSWTFNNDGDRTTETQHALPGGPAGDAKATYNYPTGTSPQQPNTLQSVSTTSPTGTQTSSYHYDSDGNTDIRTTPTGTQNLTWNHLNQLSNVTTGTNTSTYVYNADGGLLLQRDPGTTTLYLPGEELHLNTSTNTLTGQRYYTANGVTCVRTGTTSTAYSYLLTDQHGTATLSLDHTGQTPSWRAFTPYGAPRSSSLPWPDTHAFLGQPTDPLTNLDLLGARNYDPTTGRFVSLDPVLEANDPNQLGGYTYAGDDPVNKSDPDGTLGCVRLDIDGPCIPNNPPPPANNSGGGGGHNGGGHSGGGGNSGDVNVTLQHGTVVTIHQDGTIAVDGITISANSVNNDEWRFAQQVDSYYDPSRGSDVASQILGAMALACQSEEGVCTQTFAHDITAAVADRAAWLKGCRGTCWKNQLAVAGLADATALGGGDMPGIGDRLGGVNPEIVNALSAAAHVVKDEYAEIAGLAQGNISKIRVGCAGNSFDQHTGVLMADGTTKPINQVKIGDEVLATGPTSGTTTPRHVTALHLNQDTDLTDLTVATGHGSTATIHTTQHHPFWDDTQHTWIDATNLQPGDQLHTPDGQTETVTSVRSFTEQHPMYNLTIDATHTYYVLAGSTPVLVHNDDPSFDTSRQARLDAMRQAGLPTSLQPRSATYYSAGYGQGGGYQYVYDYNGKTWVVTDNWNDLNADTKHGPHWEVGEAKPGGQRDSLGRLRVDSNKTKAFYGGGC